MHDKLDRLSVAPKTGDEEFKAGDTGLGYKLKDFWIWSVSDLVSNATRGRLAEFIVAKALGISTDTIRDEWGAFDLVTETGLKIEVKSAAYIQSWSQDRLSRVSFRTRKTRAWESETATYRTEAKRQADIYIFALLAHIDKQTIDPLDLDQWKFYVLPTSVLDRRTLSQDSITLNELTELGSKPENYLQLSDAVRKVVCS